MTTINWDAIGYAISPILAVVIIWGILGAEFIVIPAMLDLIWGDKGEQ